MTHLIRKLHIIVLPLVLLLGHGGCATGSPLGALSEETRAQLGTIGVVSARFLPEVTFERPGGRFREAVRGATLGMEYIKLGAKGAIKADDPRGAAILLALGVAIAPPAALVGGVYGAIGPAPEAPAEQTEAAVRQVLVDLKMQETLCDHVVNKARGTPDFPHLVLLEDQGPTTQGETVDYDSVGAQGIDTVLEITLHSVGLNRDDTFIKKPAYEFTMTAGVKLVRIKDGESLDEGSYSYNSKPYRYAEWAANDADLFRKALSEGYKYLSYRIVWRRWNIR